MNKTIGTNNGILTVKDLITALSGLPEDVQIIVEDVQNDVMLNLVGVDLPNNDDSFAIVLKTADTFDPRQF